MRRSRLIGIASAAQVFLTFGATAMDSSQSDNAHAFEVPGTGYLIRLDDDGHRAGMIPNAELVDAMTQWIVDVSGMQAPEEPPRFRLMSPAALMAEAFTAAEGAKKAFRPPSGSPTIEALYDRRHSTILLPDGWHPNPIYLSALAHELVHHIQAQADYRYACVGAAEAPAYAVQEEWLQLFGTTLEGSYGIDRLTLFVRTTCGM